MVVRALLFLLCAHGFIACGAPAASVPAAEPSALTPAEPPATTDILTFESEAELVRHLIEEARRGRPLDSFIDTAFADDLGVALELREVLTNLPDDCPLELGLDDGYGAVAVPPPMVDDDEATVARKERLIARLRASKEVVAVCAAEVAGTQAPLLFALAIEPWQSSFRVIGWRDFRVDP